MPKVVEDYRVYRAPEWVPRIVECLLKTVPEGQLRQVGSVTLRDSAGMPSGKSRRVRGRKFPVAECRGLYRQGHGSRGASIEIVVDNVLRGVPALLLRFDLIREVVLGRVLYHEVGHHLDATIGAPAPAGEAAAEAWSTRLLKNHTLKEHPWRRLLLRLLEPVFVPLLGWVRRMRAKR